MAASPPSPPIFETFTFLFTDIEGSTRLWENYPTVMSRSLARHDALMRQAIVTNGGIVFKTVGDAFCAAFPSPGPLSRSRFSPVARTARSRR